jgi:hypothetical protein
MSDSLPRLSTFSRLAKEQEILSRIRLGMTREQTQAVLGRPDDHDTGSRKRRRPCIFKYGHVELYFGEATEDGLWLVYTEDVDANGEFVPRVLMKADPQR